MSTADAPDDLHVGCCGFSMAQDDYFDTFRLLEVQRTFYQPPQPGTLERWRNDALEDFVFTLKAWQLITHEPDSPTYRRLSRDISAEEHHKYGSFRPTDEVFEAWQATRKAAAILGAPVVVFQCPASFTPTEEHLSDMRTFFEQIADDRGDLVLGWEPRGGWEASQVEALCDELDLMRVVDPFDASPRAGPLRYFRLHGVTGYEHRYSDEELQRLLDWCEGETYCLFNNQHRVEDAQRFAELATG